MMSEASLCLWSFGSLASISCHVPPKLAGDGTMTRPGSYDRCGTSGRGVFGTGGLASTGPPGRVSSLWRVSKITHLSSLEPRGFGIRHIWFCHFRVDVEVASGGLASTRNKRGKSEDRQTWRRRPVNTSRPLCDPCDRTGPRHGFLCGKTAKNPTTWLRCRDKAEIGSSQGSRGPAN